MTNNDEFLIRGEIWLADLEPGQNRELGRARLILIISATKFNNGPAELLLVLPVTTRKQNIPAHVPVMPPEGGLNKEGYILCEQPHCIARDRLVKRLGSVEAKTMKA